MPDQKGQPVAPPDSPEQAYARPPLAEERSQAASLYGGPSALVGTLAVLFALVLLGFTIMQLRQAATSKMTVGIVAADTKIDKSAPIFEIIPDAFKINGQPVSTGDVVFRLSGLQASGTTILIRYTPQVTSDRLTQALDYVNRAGFSQVALAVEDGLTTGS